MPKQSERMRVDADAVLRRLVREADAGDMNEPSAARIRAIELLGKHLGMFVDRKHIAIKPLDQWTADEVAQLLGEDAHDLGARWARGPVIDLPARMRTITCKVETPFGSLYTHVSFDEAGGRPVDVAISTPGKHHDTTMHEALIGIGDAITATLREAAAAEGA